MGSIALSSLTTTIDTGSSQSNAIASVQSRQELYWNFHEMKGKKKIYHHYYHAIEIEVAFNLNVFRHEPLVIREPLARESLCHLRFVEAFCSIRQFRHMFGE